MREKQLRNQVQVGVLRRSPLGGRLLLFRRATLPLALFLAGILPQQAPAVAGGAAAPSAIPPFTVDSVLQNLASSHPQASRVDDALPPGVVAFEDRVYARRTDGDLALDLYRPEGKERLPVVLMIHGGGWVAGDRRMERPFVKHVAARGYVAVTVSYRLGRSGRFPAPLHDLRAAVRWLRAHADEYGIDAGHFAVAGGSAGGTLAVTLGTTQDQPDFEEPGANTTLSAKVQAIIDIDGTVSFLDNGLIDLSEHHPSPYWEYVHGPYNAHRAVWVAASPLNWVTGSCPPTLFINSTAAAPRLAGREEMAGRLRILGVTTQEVTLPGTPHPFWLVHPWFEQTIDALDRFVHPLFKTP